VAVLGVGSVLRSDDAESTTFDPDAMEESACNGFGESAGAD